MLESTNDSETESIESSGRASLAVGQSVAALLVVQVIVGFVLSTRYHATLAGAHADVQAMRTGGLFDRFLLGFHYWGSALLIVSAFLQIALMLWAGEYRRPFHWRWIASVAIFFLAIGFQVTGNLLPMDRHDVQTSLIEAGIANGVPGIGGILHAGALAGSTFSEASLQRWNLLHQFVIPAVSIAMVVLAILSVRRRGAARSIPWGSLVAVVAGCALSFLSTPTGVAATPYDFNKFEALPSWYTAPLHGSLRLFQNAAPSLGWVGAIIVPGLFAAFLMGLPVISTKLRSTPVRVCFGLFVLYFGMTAILFAGTIAPIVGDQGPKDGMVLKVAPDKLDPAAALRGQALFNQVGCADCHGTDGLAGDVGPSLAHEFKQGRNLEWLTRFISNPGALKPGSTMPSFGTKIKLGEIQDLAQFLLRPAAKS